MKPCPFCGSTDVGVALSCFVFCHACKSRGPQADEHNYCVEKWNTRAENSRAENPEVPMPWRLQIAAQLTAARTITEDSATERVFRDALAEADYLIAEHERTRA